jgi:nitrous oxide reductase accessory protein NosL
MTTYRDAREVTMRRISVPAVAAVLLLVAGALVGTAAAAEKDIEKIPFCQYCGMDRARFASTRMLVEYGNKTAIGTCSIHCAAVDMAQSYGKEIASILVADHRSGKLIDAGKAVWVIGARVPGVMAAKSRLAFSSRQDAEAFRRENGGEIADFEMALDTTFLDMPKDTRSIREWRARQGAR